MDFNLSFRKNTQTYAISPILKCTARIDMAVTVTVDDTIDFYDFSIIGRGTKNNYITFPDVDFVTPIRLNPKQKDIITIVMGDKSFRKIDQCAAMYLAISSHASKGVEDCTYYFEILSSDWLNEKWLVRYITLDDIEDKKRIQKKLDSKKISNKRSSYLEPSILENQYRCSRNLFPKEERKTMDENMFTIRIVESELGELKSGASCFFFLIELENTSYEAFSFKISDLSLLDCQNVNMTLVGYINSMTPSDRLISSGTKDRFYVGFKSDKSQSLDGELLLKFCVAIDDYEGFVEEKIHFEHIAGDWKEIGHSLKSSVLSTGKQLKEENCLRDLTQKLKTAMHEFEKQEDVCFDKITVDYVDRKLIIKALTKNDSRDNFMKVDIVMFDSNDRIIGNDNFILNGHKRKFIYLSYDKFPLYKVDSVAIVNG